MSLASRLGLVSNPFEHYLAEKEPKIAEYAVRPPYLEAISDRARQLSSFILFGNRGAGKSATRLTVFSEVWSEVAEGGAQKSPFVVNVTDFSQVLDSFRKSQLTDTQLVKLVGFYVIEQLLGWPASLEEAERDLYVEGLDKDEKALALALVQCLYLPVPEIDRGHSNSEALKLLNSAWTTKSMAWANKRWDALSKITATILASITKKYVSEDISIQESAESILQSLKSDGPNAARAVLAKLVELSMALGFSGVCVLIDKVDETNATSNSAEATARLIHPVLDHIQLLEVSGFSWIFFLWSNVQGHFNDKYRVRLDKIPSTTITWTESGLREMIERRLQFFSNGKVSLAGLFEQDVDVDSSFSQAVSLSTKSPRELIKLLDFVIREHDARGATNCLDHHSIDIGSDKYVTETIGNWYPDKLLQPVLRLGELSFVNKDVQSKFKISDQGARVKIKAWEDGGLVKQDGTMPSESGGKPVYRYTVADPRVARMIERRLIDIVGAESEPEEPEQ